MSYQEKKENIFNRPKRKEFTRVKTDVSIEEVNMTHRFMADKVIQKSTAPPPPKDTPPS